MPNWQLTKLTFIHTDVHSIHLFSVEYSRQKRPSLLVTTTDKRYGVLRLLHCVQDNVLLTAYVQIPFPGPSYTDKDS